MNRFKLLQFHLSLLCLTKKIKINYLVAVFVLCVNAWALENNTSFTLKQVFNNVKKQNQLIFKQQATAEISSTLIKAQLNNIPREMKELGKQPLLFFQHSYGVTPKLVLKNVESFYTNFFAPYEEILQKSGLFLGIGLYTSLQKFEEDITVEKISKGDAGLAITIREKNGLPGDYGIFLYSNTWLLKRAKFFEANEPAAEMVFFFKKIKNHFVPQRLKMEMLDPSKAAHFIINFYNFKAQ